MPWSWLILAIALCAFVVCVFVNWILTKEDKPK